ncbi:MAG: fibronectin type III domain-containing protein [Acutalibacteraceae bacterium]
MKKITKSLAALLFCLVLVCTSVTLVSALGKVSPTATVTYNTVTLKWSAVSGASGYEVQQYKSNKWVSLNTNIKATSYKISGLTTGTTYTFRVRAFTANSSGKKTAYGSYASVKATPILSRVTTVKAAKASSTALKLTWAKVSGATGYQVYQYNPSTKKWDKLVNTANNYYTVTSVVPGPTLQFRVRAYRKISGGYAFGAFSATCKGTIALGKPSSVKASEITANSAKLTWTKVDGAYGYIIYSYNYETGKWVNTGKKTRSTYITMTDLVCGQEYSFCVRAYSSYGGKYYYASSYTECLVKPVPAKVSSLACTSVTKDSAVISWDAAAGATAYQVCDYSTGKYVLLDTVNTTTATIPVENGKTYTIRVRAIAGKTAGAWNQVVFNSIPLQVTGLKAASKDSTATLTWNKLAGAAGYQVALYDKDAKIYTKLANVTANTYTHSGLEGATEYTYAVRAYTKNGSAVLYGDYSSTASVAVKGIKQSYATASSVSIQWSPTAGAVNYKVESYDIINEKWTDETTTPTTTYTDDVMPNSGNLYRVKAISASGAILDTSSQVTACTTGLSVKNDGYCAKINWPAVTGAKYYQISTIIYSNRPILVEQLTVTTNSVDLYLAPGVKSVIIRCFDRNPATDYSATAISQFTVATYTPYQGIITDTANADYNKNVNSQLLYLVDSINRSKTEMNKVTVASSSTVSYTVNSVTFGKTTYTGKTLQTLLNLAQIGTPEDEKISLSGTEKTSETLTFTSGQAKNSNNRTVFLSRFIEPADVNYAYLYNFNNPSAWKNGFSSVTTTVKADGSRTVKATLKQETFGTTVKNYPTARYHSGFSTTVSSLNVLGGSDMTNKKTVLGASTLTAEINAEGKLVSYSMTSPYVMDVAMKLSQDSTDTVDTNVTGKTYFLLKFTR